MAYIVTENCVDCKYTSCAAVCPADAFHEAENMLLINPDSCIDCGACVKECPVEAIFPDFDLLKEQKHWIEYNKVNASNYPIITSTKRPLKKEGCKEIK
ncbi:MAG: ferredoxin family protein [Leptospiraceae bacterium]|nr:ferredoxin family protein [Leptospiraceae bacterium]